MIRHLFDRKPDYEAAIYAEAQALADDGLDRDFVLALFPDDAEWLGDLLSFSEDIEAAYAAEAPSYFFEASLKNKFLAAARSQPAPTPQFAFGGLKTAVASLSVASSAAVVGILALGFITSGDSAPGDWNYTFKLANEKIEYTLSRGDERIAVQFRHTENRVEELRIKSSRGDTSQADIEKVERSISELTELASKQSIDPVQAEKFNGLANVAAVVLTDVKEQQPELNTSVGAATDAVGALRALTPPTPTPTPSPTATPTAEPTETPTETTTPEPTETPTPEPSPTENPSPSPTEPGPENPTATIEPGESPTEEPTNGPGEDALGTP